eukprot:594949-Lingulodinium_polyedra.AAC.1
MDRPPPTAYPALHFSAEPRAMATRGTGLFLGPLLEPARERPDGAHDAGKTPVGRRGGAPRVPVCRGSFVLPRGGP